MTDITIDDLATGTTWYVVSPGDGIGGPRYAGPDRAQAIDRLVALIAQGRDVLPGERFPPHPTDAYAVVAPVHRISEGAFLGPPRLDEEEALLAEAQALLAAQRAQRAEIESLDQGAQIGDVVFLFRQSVNEDSLCSPINVQLAVLAALRQAGLLPTTDPARDARDIASFKERSQLQKPQVRRLGRSGWNR